MNHQQKTQDRPEWAVSLEIIGPEIFLAYRKRLMQPGISLLIWRDQLGLSLPDVACRVYAGRRLIRDGQDFEALAAIRSGRWRELDQRSESGFGKRYQRDGLSRMQVLLGGLLFFLLVSLSLLTASGSPVAVLLVLLALVAVASASSSLRGWPFRRPVRSGRHMTGDRLAGQ